VTRSTPAGGRRLSLELERHLAFKPNLGSYPPGGAPYAPATPLQLQAVLSELVAAGWSAATDPCTGVLSRVLKRPGDDPSTAQSCTSDVTTGIFETTIRPATTLLGLEAQQRELDEELAPVLERHGLFLWCTETPPAVTPTRQHYALFQTYWRGEYAFRRHRGEDHYWFSWTIGNNPALDVTVEEAIPFLNVVLRLTGLTLFLRRLGSISGGRPAPAGRLTVRPWAIGQLWGRSPYSSDIFRGEMMGRDFAGWADYLRVLMGLRLSAVVGADGRPYRVQGDPTFERLVRATPPHGWLAASTDGVQRSLQDPRLRGVVGLQRQVAFSRLRWAFDRDAPAAELLDAVDAGEETLRAYLAGTVGKCYIEVRSDACPPPGEELATLALYLGLIENLDAAEARIVRGRPRRFWRTLYLAAESGPMEAQVEQEWIPDVIGEVLDIAHSGLVRRGLGEERLLLPLTERVDRLTSPAEEALEVFHAAGGGHRGVAAFAEQYSARTNVRATLH
jgi:hypothetical protein